MPVHKVRKHGNASALRPLSEIDARYERLPSTRVKLTAEERELLKDPDWIDEDEADLILALREEKEHGLRGENIRDFARRHGRDLRG